MKTTENTKNSLIGRKINYRQYGSRDDSPVFDLKREYDSEVVGHNGRFIFLGNGERIVSDDKVVGDLLTFGLFRERTLGIMIEIRLD